MTVKGKYNKIDDKKKKQGKQKNKNKVLKCFECHKERHFKRDCPERKSKQREKKNQSGDAAVVEDEAYESAGVLIASEVNQ